MSNNLTDWKTKSPENMTIHEFEEWRKSIPLSDLSKPGDPNFIRETEAAANRKTKR